MNALYREINDGLREELVQSLGRHRFRLWFRDTTVTDVSDGGLTLAVPTDVHRTWLQFTFGDVLQRACERVLGEGVHLQLEVSPEQDRKRVLREELPQTPEAWDDLLSARVPQPSLDTFHTRPSGRFPLMLLRQVLTGGGARGESLIYLCGACGSGKTHLLRGVETDRARARPGAALYLTARQFTHRYVSALRTGEIDALRAFETDLTRREILLIDDVHELEPRTATQRELVRLMEQCVGTRTRFVLAGRRHPREVDGFSPGLRSRLLGGVMLNLPVPARDLLGDILEERARSIGVALPEAVKESVLDRTASVRGSVEIVDRWAVASAEIGRALDVEWLDEVAPSVAATAREEVIRRAKDLVARHFSIDRNLLDRPTKVRSARYPRRVAMYLVYRACALPLVELGAAFGLRSHSSVSRAIREMRKLRAEDAGVEQLVDGLLARI